VIAWTQERLGWGALSGTLLHDQPANTLWAELQRLVHLSKNTKQQALVNKQESMKTQAQVKSESATLSD
jgi:hypothetical protein